MALRIEPTGAPLGVFVYGLDMDAITEAEITQLRQAFLDNAVLVFRGQTMNPEQMLALSEIFGECGLHPIPALRHPEIEKLIILAANNGEPVADDDPTGNDRIGAIPWHTDLIYTEALNRGALLRAVKVPQEEGETGWIDTARAYDQLPEAMKERIADLKVIHSYATAHGKQTMVGGSPNLFPDVIHPLVSTHPYNGRKILNASPNSAKEIVGLPKQESDELLAYLAAHACRENEAYKHEWKADDVVLWDNWRTMHRAYGHLKRYPRLMHRTTLKEELRTGRWVEDTVAADMSRGQVELGIVSTLPSTLIAIELAQIAESLDFDRVAFSDTAPLIYHAAYPAVTAILMRTERIRVGPYVTNPVTRHWSIHAANARAFDELAPGRFFLGIGTGDGAVHSVGLKPAKLAEFRIAASELRRTLPQGTPIHMAFSGPKGMAVAGALADELTIGTGLDVTSLRNLGGLARTARQEAGVTTPLKLWLPVPVHFAASEAEIPALRAAAGGMASLAARFAFSGGFEGKNVPERFQPAMRQMLDGYQFAHHAKSSGNPNAGLFDADPEIRDYVLDRFALIGTPDQCAERLATIREVGIDGFWLMPSAPSADSQAVRKKLELAARAFAPLRDSVRVAGDPRDNDTPGWS